MSDQRGRDEQEVKEKEENAAGTVESTAGRPPGGDRDLGSNGQVQQAAMLAPGLLEATEEAVEEATEEAAEETMEEAAEETTEEATEEATEETMEEAAEETKEETTEEATEETTEEATEEAASQADLAEDGEQQGAWPHKAADVGNSTATVKVMLAPEGHVMTVAFAIGLSIQDLKRHFATELKVPAEVLQISLGGEEVEEQNTLMELGVRPHGATQLEMSSSDPTNHPLRPLRPPQHDHMPDVITVRVHADQGVFQDVVVEIERPPQQKVFLGGYRHRVTGAEYHHAAVQTPPRRRPDRGVAVFSRDTQTVMVRNQKQQCPISTSTQMTGIGCYVSCLEDKLVSPGNYITAEQYHARRLSAVIRLQAWARRWLRKQRDRRLAWLEMEERRRREEMAEQLRDDEHGQRMDPQSREDFTLLYHALSRWRREEEQSIDSSLRGAERKAALCKLLDQETQMIASIGRHRIVAQHSNYDKAIRTFLDKCADPKRWRSADGHMTELSTQQSLRAGRLRDLYTSLSLEDSQDQRTHTLQTLRQTVQEHDCQLTRDIVELIDREADLITRGVKKTKLEGLRQRISTLFLQYIKTPAFNPAVTKLLKVPQNPSQLRNNIHYCRGCRRYLQSADFSLAANGRLSVGRCRVCAEQDNVVRRLDDFSLYKNILTRLRGDEAQIAYLLQEKDVCYLVEVVWEGHSALSTCSDLRDLVLVRWDPLRDWSPWNCILLSKEEAAAHMKLDNVNEAYGAAFTDSIKHKHTEAKSFFDQIPVMAKYLH